MIGTAVVHPNDQRFAVAEIGHAGITGDRQRWMSGRQRGHVEDFAVGGQPAMKSVAIPGSQAFLAIVDVLFRHVHASADRIGFADAVGPAALWHRLAHGDDARAAGNPVFGVNPAEFSVLGAICQQQARSRHGSDLHYPANST